VVENTASVLLQQASPRRHQRRTVRASHLDADEEQLPSQGYTVVFENLWNSFDDENDMSEETKM
jgi:hypothetical protein